MFLWNGEYFDTCDEMIDFMVAYIDWLLEGNNDE